jgi:saccharopine dehydrogenase-like NADP-dependent oxidoreductase
MTLLLRFLVLYRVLRVAVVAVLLLLLLLLLSHFPPTAGHEISIRALEGKSILVVGGSGRVGGSVVTQLVSRHRRYCLRVTVAGTRPERLTEARRRWMLQFPQHQHELSKIDFLPVNCEDASTVRRALLANNRSFDLVIHTAGPFQGKARVPNGVLEACIEAGIPYLDVCDDYCTSRAAQTRYAGKEVRQSCVLSTGCWPGVSSLMAGQLVSETLRAFPALTPDELSVDFSFFTAG